MSLMYRKIVKLGPFRLNIGRKGLSSSSLQVGRWSWPSRSRKRRFSLPGASSGRSR
jgi:hypothetical protein